MKNKKEVIVYWSILEQEIFKNYDNPTNLYKEIINLKEKKSSTVSFFSCPAVSDRLKSSFVFKSNFDANIFYDFSDINNPLIMQDEGTEAFYLKPSSIKNAANIAIKTSFLFFSEEDIECLINPPSFHKPTDFYKKGFIPGGKMNIGKWFRPVTLEIQMWDIKNSLSIKKEDPLFYLELLTDKNVIMQKFEFNDTIKEIASYCTEARHREGRNLPLSKRYDVFIKNKKHEELIKFIKESLV